MPLFEYEIDPIFEDHLLLNKVAFYQKRKMHCFLRIVLGILAALFCYSAFMNLFGPGRDDDSFVSFIFSNFMMIICGVLAIAYNPIFTSLFKRSIKSAMETHKQFCVHTNVKIYDNYLSEYCRYVSANYSYDIFTELVATPQLMALYCAPNSAVIIPRRLFDDNAWNWLYGFLTDKCSKNGAKITIINKTFK